MFVEIVYHSVTRIFVEDLQNGVTDMIVQVGYYSDTGIVLEVV